jgi:hypothetical protein
MHGNDKAGGSQERLHAGDKEQGLKKGGAKENGLKRENRNQNDVKGENIKGYIQPIRGKTHPTFHYSVLTHQPVVNIGFCVLQELVYHSACGMSGVSKTM